MAMAGMMARNKRGRELLYDPMGKCVFLHSPAHFPHKLLPPFEHCNAPPRIARPRFLPPFEHCNFPHKFSAHVLCYLLNTASLPRTFLAHVCLPPFEHFALVRKMRQKFTCVEHHHSSPPITVQYSIPTVLHNETLSMISRSSSRSFFTMQDAR